MANEVRLIDANALSEELSTLTMTITGLRAGRGVLREFMTEYRESCLRIIDEQPTVDAVEVVHGRWKNKQTNSIFTWHLECSVCGADYHTPVGYNYCPNCGAKMDGERTDNV